MKRVAWVSAVVFAILLALILTWQLRSIVLLFVLSVALAAAARAPVDYLMSRQLSRTLAMIIVYGIGLAGLLALLYGFGLLLAEEFGTFVQDITTTYGQLGSGWQAGGRLGTFLAAHLPSPAQFTAFLTSDEVTAFAETGLVAIQTLASIVSQLLLALVVSIYWTVDQLRFERLWLSLLPAERRAPARNIWRALEAGIGAYIRSEIVQSVLVAGLLGLGFRLMGLQYAFTLALIVALVWLVPLVGGLIAMVPVGLVAWLSGPVTWVGEPVVAAVAVLYTLLVLGFMEFVVERWLYRRDRYGGVLVLLVMILMVDAFGLLGLLVAPFVATALQICLSELITKPILSPAASSIVRRTGPVIDLSTLQARLAEVYSLVNHLQSAETTPAALRMASMTERLDQLLKKANNGES